MKHQYPLPVKPQLVFHYNRGQMAIPQCYFRENARRLVLENESLNTQMRQTEKDTIDVVTYLKRQDLEKDKQVGVDKFTVCSLLNSKDFTCALNYM